MTPPGAEESVLVAGASGLVWSALVRRLLAGARGPRVVSVARRPNRLGGARLIEVVADFERLGEAGVPAAATAFCALGTTMAELLGEVAPEEVLDAIFGSFCIGK